MDLLLADYSNPYVEGLLLDTGNARAVSVCTFGM